MSETRILVFSCRGSNMNFLLARFIFDALAAGLSPLVDTFTSNMQNIKLFSIFRHNSNSVLSVLNEKFKCGGCCSILQK